MPGGTRGRTPLEGRGTPRAAPRGELPPRRTEEMSSGGRRRSCRCGRTANQESANLRAGETTNGPDRKGGNRRGRRVNGRCGDGDERMEGGRTASITPRTDPSGREDPEVAPETANDERGGAKQATPTAMATAGTAGSRGPVGRARPRSAIERAGSWRRAREGAVNRSRDELKEDASSHGVRMSTQARRGNPAGFRVPCPDYLPKTSTY